MRSCTPPREPLADYRQPCKVRERPLRAPGNRAAGRGRALRLRSKPRKARGRPHETKSRLNHLIKRTEEREAAAGLATPKGQRPWRTIQFKHQQMEISHRKASRQANHNRE